MIGSKLRYFINLLLVLSTLGFLTYATKPNSQTNTLYQYTSTKAYLIDTTKSKLYWKCHHTGELKLNHGIISMENNRPIAMNLSIDMNSISNADIDNDLLQGTLVNVLKSIEFFNTAIYPEARFESHEITHINDSTFHFVGDFIIFEKGLCEGFEGTISLKADSLYIVAKDIILNRTDWGIYYLSANNPNPKEEEEDSFVVSDTIYLDAHLVAYKQP